MLPPEELKRLKQADRDDYDALLAHIDEQEAALVSPRETITKLTENGIAADVRKLKHLDDLRETVRTLNDLIHQQDAALAEARRVIELTASIEPHIPMESTCTACEARKWLAAHPAPSAPAKAPPKIEPCGYSRPHGNCYHHPEPAKEPDGKR